MTSLLVQRRGGLGDTLLMLPVLRALRRRQPDAILHFAGVLEFAAILRDYGAVDAARSSEDLALWAFLGDRGEAVRDRLRGYTLVIADDPAVLALAGHGTQVMVFDTAARGREPFGLQLAQRVGLSPRWPDDAWLVPPSLPRPTGPQSRGPQLRGPVLLAPGSGGRHKCWPPERWRELAHDLVVQGDAVQVVVGPAEMERDDPRRWPWAVEVAFVVEAQPLALAAHVRTARAFVGNDSGPTHLAAALGVPVVALFGPTDPRIWAPVGPHVTVVAGRGGSLAAIEAAAVATAVRG